MYDDSIELRDAKDIFEAPWTMCSCVLVEVQWLYMCIYVILCHDSYKWHFVFWIIDLIGMLAFLSTTFLHFTPSSMLFAKKFQLQCQCISTSISLILNINIIAHPVDLKMLRLTIVESSRYYNHTRCFYQWA